MRPAANVYRKLSGLIKIYHAPEKITRPIRKWGKYGKNEIDKAGKILGSI